MAKKSAGKVTLTKGVKKIETAKTYRVLIDMSRNETAGHLGMAGVDHCCMPQPQRHANGDRRLHAFATGKNIDALVRNGRDVTVLADTEVEGKKAQKNVSTKDRFDGGRRGPRAVGELI